MMCLWGQIPDTRLGNILNQEVCVYIYICTPKNRHPVIKAFEDIPAKRTRGSLWVAERVNSEIMLALSRNFLGIKQNAGRFRSPLSNK